MKSRIFDVRKLKIVYFSQNSDLKARETIGGEITARAIALPLLQNDQTGSGAHPVSYSFSAAKVGR
jgi:hypothetical protein